MNITRLIQGYKVLFAIDSEESLAKLHDGMLLAADARCYSFGDEGGALLDTIIEVVSTNMPLPEKRKMLHNYDMTAQFVAMTDEEFAARSADYEEDCEDDSEFELMTPYDDFGLSAQLRPFWYAVEKVETNQED